MQSQSLALSRTVIGLLQGLGLYLLYLAHETKSWPATDGLVFAALLVPAVYVPPMLVAALGHFRALTLVVWIIIALAVCAGLGWYDIFRDPIGGPVAPATGRNLPTPGLWLALGAALFIAHALVAAGELDRKVVAKYQTYFDVSWKQAIQFVLAGVFVGAMWLLLWLGAELFRLIKIEFLADLIKRNWFWIPVTSVALSYAIHVTDVRAVLVQGVRTLKLTLLSWLLPIMVCLAVAFVLALPFTGLEVLWNTRRATTILLCAVAALVFLINAAYQDGQTDGALPRLLTYARVVGAIVIVPLVALASYGLFVRVQQYGWTPQRVVVCACIVVASCYAAGYLLAAARAPLAMNGLERTNIVVACIIVAAVLSLFSPIADPARISVADQLSRLQGGAVTPERFDFGFLRFDSGRYGRAALDRLAASTDGPQATTIAQRAKEAQQLKVRWQAQPKPIQTTPQNRLASITVVHPAGAVLPAGFAEQDWNALPRRWLLPVCLTAATQAKCEAVLVDINDDGKSEVLVFGPSSTGSAFAQNDDGTWRFLGTIANLGCAGARDALRAGRFDVVPPAYKEIVAGDQRLRINTECILPAR